MTLHTLTAPPPAWLGEAMETFERQFTYPLGASGSFHVSHGRQYLCFFQSMGEARVLVMERAGMVVGTVALVRRPLRKPDGSVTMGYYVCDLKVAPGRMAGPVLVRLMSAVREHVLATGMGPVYGIVMGGTARTPVDYTGRVGSPSFAKVGKLAVLRIPLLTPSHHEMASGCREATLAEIADIHTRFTPGAWVPLGGDSALRSEMRAVPITTTDGHACGLVEDTRLGKRLLLGDGGEMRAAHLSQFAFHDAESGMRLVQAAMAVAAQAGFPALFVALPDCGNGENRGSSADRLKERLVQEMGALCAPAIVYGTGFNEQASSPATWWVDTAEI